MQRDNGNNWPVDGNDPREYINHNLIRCHTRYGIDRAAAIAELRILYGQMPEQERRDFAYGFIHTAACSCDQGFEFLDFFYEILGRERVLECIVEMRINSELEGTSEELTEWLRSKNIL